MLAKGKLAVDLGRDGDDVVGRDQKLHAAIGGLVEGGPGDDHLVPLDERLADREALGQLERVRHRAADEDRVGLVEQPIDHLDFIGDLCAAENHDERAFG